MKIEDPKDFKRWLEDKPRDMAALLAARCALRVLPLINRAYKDESSLSDIILPIFWCNAANLFASLRPNRLAASAASAASASAATAAYAAATAAVSAASAATAAYAAATSDAATAATTAVYANSAAAYAAASASAATAATAAYAASATIYENISKDIERYESRKSAADLSRVPLWHEDKLPHFIEEEWTALRSRLLDLKQDWEVWTDWYEGRLSGGPLIEEIELGDPDNGIYGRVTFPPEEYKDPGALNPKIKALLESPFQVDDIIAATPLAETISLRPDGKFDVSFLPVSDLFKSNIDRLYDALNSAISANLIGERSSEAIFINEIITDHIDNPQRIFDDCNLAHKAIQSLLAQSIVPDEFRIQRLLDALNITRTDILANSEDVKEAHHARIKLAIKEREMLQLAQTLELKDDLASLESITAEKFFIEMSKDCLVLVSGTDRADALYRIMSRVSRIYGQSRSNAVDALLDDGAKLAIVKAQPHMAQIIETLLPYLGLV